MKNMVLHRKRFINGQTTVPKKMTKKERQKTIENIEKEMKKAAKELDFEKATELRDMLFELKSEG